MSVGVSLNIISQDFILIALYHYSLDFTRLRRKILTFVEIIFIILALVDAILFIVNIFNEMLMTYSMNMVGNAYVLGYETSELFAIHVIFNIMILTAIISCLIIKCIRIPRVYWGRYSSLIIGGLVILLIKFIFINKIIDMRFDISILAYSLLGVLLYWNTFWYSKKNMLRITHAMIIDHMQVPVILFDYEENIADFNTALKELFPDIEYDKKEENIEWFINNKNCPDLKKKDNFTWIIKDKIYECKVHNLKTKGNRLLGLILVMQDVTELTNAYDELERSVTFDALTGLYNKRSFYMQIEKESYNTVCVANINNLAIINDKFGQETGDRVLIGLANIAEEKTARADFIARLDGGNIVILTKAKELDALELMTDIKDTVSKRLSTKKMNVSIEYGVAAIEKEEEIDLSLNLAIGSMRNKKMLSSQSARKSLVGSLKQGLNEYDMQTDKQIERERVLCDKFAKTLALSDIDKGRLAMLATLHDIGKVAIPNSILMKEGELDEDEKEIMRTHTEKGYRIAKAAAELEPIALSILSHHERYDGSGYPNGLIGDDIPLLARIFSIVDAYDAMTHDRPYRKTKTKDEAIKELIECSNSQFDPKLVEAFIKTIK